jgi:hypothetical protein
VAGMVRRKGATKLRGHVTALHVRFPWKETAGEKQEGGEGREKASAEPPRWSQCSCSEEPRRR